MSKLKVRKHNIDIMFLMILFLVFTFSAVSVLLMAVNSYRSVVYANEENASDRTAIAYIREQVRSHDKAGAVEISNLDGINSIRMEEQDGIYLYIYAYDGNLMELEAKDGSGVTADFGNKIMEIKDLQFSWKNNQLIEVEVVDSRDNKQIVEIGIKSGVN